MLEKLIASIFMLLIVVNFLSFINYSYKKYMINKIKKELLIKTDNLSKYQIFCKTLSSVIKTKIISTKEFTSLQTTVNKHEVDAGFNNLERLCQAIRDDFYYTERIKNYDLKQVKRMSDSINNKYDSLIRETISFIDYLKIKHFKTVTFDDKKEWEHAVSQLQND